MTGLGEDLRIALAAFAARSQVLVAVDFDGTLAPFVTDPLQARAVPGGLEALRDATALGGVTTAVVSGRDLATLAMLTGIGPDDGITLIGSHGAQTNRGDRAELVSAAGAAFLDEAAAALLATLIGIPAATIVARESGREDPGFEVIDEVAGQWIALIGVRTDWRHAVLALMLFRLFDIWKPWPIRRLEELPAGIGIMLDDVAAGVLALVVGVALARWV